EARWLMRLATGELDEFLDLAFGHTIEGMYGPPEYGGNRGRVGWAYTRWPGGPQPHSYTFEQISQADADEAAAGAGAGDKGGARGREGRGLPGPQAARARRGRTGLAWQSTSS